MSCKLPNAVAEYLAIVEGGELPACREQKALAALVRQRFAEERLLVDEQKISRYCGIARYFGFNDLFPWQKFLTALWDCVFTAEGLPRWKTIFCMVGRGAGKDGFIAVNSLASISPYNSVRHYDVDICANNEEQAKRPCFDIIEALENPAQEKKLDKFFYHTKEVIQGRKNLGCIKGRTNNPSGRDGMRSGKIIFNEVHAYQDYANINVFTSGQGKTAEPRRGIFTSNGVINDGPLDDYLARSRRILFEGEPDNGFLPFVCCLDDKAQADDPRNWHMANPSLRYLPALMQETADEYRDWKDHPEQCGDFLPKRMGLRAGFREISVTDYEKVLATKGELPDMNGWPCVVGIDYAELNDWAAVNIHFRRGADRFDINHAWVCTQSKTLHRVKAPWRTWAEMGLLTVVDDVSIHPDLLAEYIAKAGQRYIVRMVALDNFRWTMLSESLRKIGFDASDKTRVKLARPSDIMRVDPLIQECFDRHLFHWGDNPCLRWAVNNTKRVRSSRSIGVDTGNFIYAKIEAKSRKTDPFMALAASMTAEAALGTGEVVTLPPVGAFVF